MERGIIRRLDSVGRVVIPSSIRERLGLNEMAACEILPVEDGVLIRKAIVDENDVANLVKALQENISYLDMPEEEKRDAYDKIKALYDLFKKYRMEQKENK